MSVEMRFRHLILWQRFFSLALFVLLCGTPLLNADELKLGLSFPPVTQASHREFTQRQLTRLGIEHIRFAENWSLREPTEGQFVWGPLDQRMAWAKAQNLSVMLTIQSTGPKWACEAHKHNAKSCVFSHREKFRHYIEALLQRYPHQIARLQFGNEWQSLHGYIGSAEQFINGTHDLYAAVQQYSSTTKVVLGGFSSESLNLLAYCEGAIDRYYESHHRRYYEKHQQALYCRSPGVQSGIRRVDRVLAQSRYDMIDIHLYDDAENWPLYFHAITQAVLALRGEVFPVIVSEFGGPNLHRETPYSDRYQAQRLALYLEVLSQLEIEGAYYFQLVQGSDAHPSHRESGLFRRFGDTLIEKPAFEVLQNRKPWTDQGLPR